MRNTKQQTSSFKRAYVLIDVAENRALEVARSLRDDFSLSTVDVINGPYRVIAIVEGDNISAMVKTILVDIKRLNAVKDIVVYVSIPEEELKL